MRGPGPNGFFFLISCALLRTWLSSTSSKATIEPVLSYSCCAPTRGSKYGVSSRSGKRPGRSSSSKVESSSSIIVHSGMRKGSISSRRRPSLLALKMILRLCVSTQTSTNSLNSLMPLSFKTFVHKSSQKPLSSKDSKKNRL